ncbi:MAG: serine/threonine protein kinase [Labilithrix sp.]|nr:serine/threonine protein kinase [Labilithrix sp.]MCW5817106.1 serine/threonine protein kinase [Labilithrix sp.]
MDAARSSVPAAGTLIAGRYRVGSPIGEGGMGVVLAARDEREVKDVAIKLLQVTGEANIERFLREARLVTKIASDHVVRVLDVGQLGHSPFIVMERLEGEDFGAKVRDVGSMPLAQVADCVLQTCEALAHAHGAGIVHRDIKASNLFEHRRKDGARLVKVLDFGISKMIASTGSPEIERTLTRTRDGGFLGSPPYMSPEHVKDPRNVDGRADLWSLGVVAYRLLSTRFPFPGETTGEVLAAILESRPAKLRSLGVNVPEEIDHIIDRCLKRDRDDRYDDAGQLARAFAPYASPRWQDYAERVPRIVSTASVPSPAETSRKRKKIVEPSTATVPPPMDEAVTLALDEQSARHILPPSVRSASVQVVDEIPSPLEVLSTGPIPLMIPPPEPKRRTGLIVGLFAVILLGAAGGAAYGVLAKKPPPTVTAPPAPTPEPPAPAPPPSAPIAPATTSAVAIEVPAPAPAPAPAPEPHPSNAGKAVRPTRGVRPPAPRPSPAPHEAPAPKKPELEGNPYGH